MDSKKAGVTALAVLALGAGVITSVALGASSAKHHPGKSKALRAAATTTSTTTTGSFASNEDATHEAGESAAREAAEDSGHAGPRGNGTFKPNEDATHEAGESAAREAQEDAGQTPTSP